jgi:hypothetical protein
LLVHLCFAATLRFATLRYATLRGTTGDYGGLRLTTGDFAFSRAFYTVDSGFLRPTSPRYASLRYATLPYATLRYPSLPTSLEHLVGFVVAIALAFRRLLVPVHTSMGTSAGFWGPFRQIAHLLRLLLTAQPHTRTLHTMNLSVDPPTSTTINADEEEVKLPSISFGYHCGKGLTTMHTSIMLMLSGSSGDGLVECVRNKTIERMLARLVGIALAGPRPIQPTFEYEER